MSASLQKKEQHDLDMLVKETLCRKGMSGRQGSDERLYMKSKDGGRGLKIVIYRYISRKKLNASSVVRYGLFFLIVVTVKV